MPIGVALIGGGIWAREEHAPAIDACKDLELRAVYSRSKTSAESIAKVVSNSIDLYADDLDKGFDDVLKRDDIEAVVVSLPILNQPQYIKAALVAGKHVLSEKPVAENVQEAVDLVKWYRATFTCPAGPTWAVAENFRFLNTYSHASKLIRQNLGPITGFSGRFQFKVGKEWKFNKTEWRRTPTHQGGYLLDGGVHYIAGLRELFGSSSSNSSSPAAAATATAATASSGPKIESVVAFTRQIQPYLPPIDTADVLLRTDTGVTGTLQMSGGTSITTSEWTVVCEKGWVKVEAGGKVTAFQAGNDDAKAAEPVVTAVTDERTGVPPEIREWAKSLLAKKPNASQEPEQALADLEVIELILKSGQQNGTLLTCKHQSGK